ncbi:hypothetical protein [Rhodopirellula sp. P2]|uniref:hypothetical protein n=1 Tax=Rhodopirellula sp. P2 TaxID=2127060 RepID=UPI002368EC8F|nr:hypothetical protein [Rhodopirellula sp. P2]WDQ18757.1 hypothetical protein PSR62_09470 [Rhodopirellula sp. P2]
MQFRIAHLILALTWAAIVFALVRFHMVFWVALCPVTIGPLAGRAASGTLEGMVLGLLSTMFWCFLASVFAGMVLASFAVAAFLQGLGLDTPVGLVIGLAGFYSLISLFAGYIGGRIAIA